MQKNHIVHIVVLGLLLGNFAILITGCIPKGKGQRSLSLEDVQKTNELSESTRLSVRKKTVQLTVWIHGTVSSVFSLVNPRLYRKGDDPRESLVGRFAYRFRNQPILNYDQVFGEEGFYLFDTVNRDSSSGVPQAANYVIPAYIDILHEAGSSYDIEDHAVFGWDGLLSQDARRAAGERLYEALVTYRDKILNTYGVEPVINILAHSHGGNVALWLAECEKKEQKKLAIDLLFMYGTPMQVETANCIISPIFKRMFLGYSRGDGVQRRDYFSTGRHKSFMRMSDIADIRAFLNGHAGLARADLGFMIGGNDKRVTHTNMWMLGRSVPIFSFMDPLPLVVLTPLVVAAIDRLAAPECTHYKVDMRAEGKRCWVALASCDDKLCRHQGVHKRRFERVVNETEFKVCDRNVFKILHRWAKRMTVEWRPFDPSRDVLFNMKNFKAISGTVYGV